MNARSIRILILLVLSSCKGQAADRGMTELQLRVSGFCHVLVLDLESNAETYRQFIAAGADQSAADSLLWIGHSFEARTFYALDLTRRFNFCANARNPRHAGAGDLIGSLTRNQDRETWGIGLPPHEETLRLLEALTERAKQIEALPLHE